MKNIDIEKLKRRNPYEIPDCFFSEMQKNVLEKVVESTKRKRRIMPMNYFTAAAASFVLFMGTILFIYSSNKKVSIQEKIVKNQGIVKNIHPKLFYNSNDINKYSEKKSFEIEKKDDKKFNYSQNSESNQNKLMLTDSKEIYNGFKAISILDRNFDKALNKLNAQELAEQSKRYEIDTYLDLY